MSSSAKSTSNDTAAAKPKPVARKKKRTRDAQPSKDVMIVGIGASAGGLEAFKTFFSRVPTDCGLAFVLVQHLSPDHESMLTGLLGQVTGMPVLEAADGARIEPDHVYVIPPDATLTVVDGTLCVRKPAPPREHRWPINSLFVSLAEDQGENAVCVVLSGTGSDGAQGLHAVRKHGGLALAQAGFDHVAMTGMPSSAVATGLVDAVLQAADMPARLLAYREQKRHTNQGKAQPADMDASMETICGLLRAEVGHDFSQYKKKTLVRRIQRRMLVAQTESARDYIEYLREHPHEHEFLFREFLIGVTSFFRDPEAFDALKNGAIPSMLANKDNADVLRVWVPGCATGEEAYSIAIVLREVIADRRGPKVQIFATDIDDHAVTAARAGRYSAPLEGMSDERLERWFHKDHGDYFLIKEIRDMCIFSPHSVIKDPPFSRLDLVSCRNLMIYMNAELQNRLMHLFHYALRPGGYLLLGSSERFAGKEHLFTEVDKKQRLYVRSDDHDTHARNFSRQSLLDVVAGQTSRRPSRSVDDAIDQRAQQALEPWSPAYVVIDANHEILRFGGHAGRYLAPSSGVASLNLFQLLDKSLRGTVYAAVLQAFADETQVIREEPDIKINGGEHSLRLIVQPLPQDDGHALCMVAFDELEYASGVADVELDSKPGKEQARTQALEKELRAVRAQMRSAVDLHEITNEELRSANEEYQSVNEELQSTNEELETSSEEMQSINEELQTVNAELNSKNKALQQANDDVRNLLDSTRIATVFLDSELRIRSYTPTMSELFHLRPGDKGRPITDISPLVVYPQLGVDVSRVLHEESIIERLLNTNAEGKTFLLRMRPYVTVDDAVNGVVLTFVDVTESQRVNTDHARLAAIVNSSHDAIFGFSLDDRITSWNPAAEKIFGLPAAQMMGKPLNKLLPTESSTQVKAFFVDRACRQQATEFEMIWVQPDGAVVPLEMDYSPVCDDDGRTIAGKIIARDITERHHAEQHTQMMMGELNHRVKNTLATVQAIALQTLANASSLAAFRKSFISRLMALSNTHNLLAGNAWSGASMTDVVSNELAPYQRGDDRRVALLGEPLTLSTKVALALSMGVHELTTNAVKYGALSVPGGKVTVSWKTSQVGDQVWLHLVWRESGGPPAQPPKHSGFGSRLITEGLPYELDGKVSLEYSQSGVICTIDAPLRREESA